MNARARDRAPAERELAEYRRKRDFAKSPEPSGDAAGPTGGGRPQFVVQRHRFRRRHYDFRLEIDGVLVSWAVPKGLTLDPSQRHLAVHVEDHPLDYFEFEGVIPEGEYGAGDVIVWDQGTWGSTAPRTRRAVEDGELHVELFGERLRGRFVLVRTDRRGGRNGGGQENWLVLHKRDEHAVAEWDPELHPTSVLSGRTNDEVRADPDRLWTRAGEQVLHEDPVTVPGPTDEELTALDALRSKGRWSLQGRELALTNLDKVLFAARRGAPVHQARPRAVLPPIAPVMVPYLADRPLNLHRYPDGVDRKGFWQKEAPSCARLDPAVAQRGGR